MKVNFKEWKKVSEHKDHSVFRNKDGHELKVAHKGLHPATRGQLAALPLAEAPKTVPPTSSNEPKKAPQMFAEGSEDGVIEEQASPQAVDPTTQLINQKAEYIQANNPGMSLGDAMAKAAVDQSAFQDKQASEDQAAAESTPEAMHDQAMASLPSTPEEAQRMEAAPPAMMPSTTPLDPNMVSSKTSRAPAGGPAPVTGSAPDTFGVNAQFGATEKGLHEIETGKRQELKAITDQAAGQQKILQEQQKNIQQTQSDYNNNYAKLDAERQALQKDIADKHIDPTHFLSSMGTGTKIASIIGLIAGGIASGATGQENLAQKFLQKQIDQDIEAQKLELGKKENLLSANLRQFGNMRDAMHMTRIMQSDIIANQMQQEAAKASSPLAAARLKQEAGNLHMTTAPLMGQLAMGKTLTEGVQAGTVSPETLLRSGRISPHDQEPFRKELAHAQDAVALRDNTLASFDQIAKLDTVLSTFNPQTRLKIDALKGAALDKLTKDISGRVTPETVKLIGGMFNTKWADEGTIKTQRQELNSILSQGMHYPTLKAYKFDVDKMGRNNMQGQDRIPKVDLVPNRK